MTRQFVAFTVPGQPVPKARARVYTGRAVTPERTARYEAEIGWRARAAMRGRRPTTARLAVVVDLYGERAPTCDVDNVAKALLDGMGGIVFVNDRQVDDLHVRRHLDTPDARAEIVVRELGGPTTNGAPTR